MTAVAIVDGYSQHRLRGTAGDADAVLQGGGGGGILLLLLLLFLTNQVQITHNPRLDTHIHMQIQHVRSFSLAVRFPRAKTPKVNGAINVLSLDFSSVAG